MLSAQEQAFYDYWKQARLQEKKVLFRLKYGISSGIIFAGLIMLSWVSGWDKHVYKVSMPLFITIVLGLLGVAVFFSVLKMQLRWDKREQYFKLLQRKLENL